MFHGTNGKSSARLTVPAPTGIARRSAVGYIRVSTSMQAEDGLSLDAQTAAINSYCAGNDLRLIKIYQDVESGGKSDRRGLADALATKADVFVVLKFDRLSRSIMHFCQLYEDYFASKVELVAIREAIRLDSALGRALVNILMVFAQMEREATGERVRESIRHIRSSGFHFGKVPYGYDSKPSEQNPKFRVLIENTQEQAVLTQIRNLVESGEGPTAIADKLNAQGIKAPQGPKWTLSLIWNLKTRRGWHKVTPANQRPHTDEECKARMSELRAKGHTYQQIANILNDEGYLPFKGKKFNEVSICKLLGNFKERKVLTPREWCQQLSATAGKSLSLSFLAEQLKKAGYQTPRGNLHWWPAQVSKLLDGGFDSYYHSKMKPIAKPRNLHSSSAAFASI